LGCDNFFASNNQHLCFTDVSWQQLGGFSKQRKKWGWGIIVVLPKDQRQEVRVRSVVNVRDEINGYWRFITGIDPLWPSVMLFVMYCQGLF
jgi:hypothetical protein